MICAPDRLTVMSVHREACDLCDEPASFLGIDGETARDVWWCESCQRIAQTAPPMSRRAG